VKEKLMDMKHTEKIQTCIVINEFKKGNQPTT
jgi:hypothetical protein